MMEQSSFARGFLAGILLMIGGQAVNWFIAWSGAPDASTLRTTAVALQAILGFSGASWLYIRQRSRAVRPG